MLSGVLSGFEGVSSGGFVAAAESGVSGNGVASRVLGEAEEGGRMTSLWPRPYGSQTTLSGTVGSQRYSPRDISPWRTNPILFAMLIAACFADTGVKGTAIGVESRVASQEVWGAKLRRVGVR